MQHHINEEAPFVLVLDGNGKPLLTCSSLELDPYDSIQAVYLSTLRLRLALKLMKHLLYKNLTEAKQKEQN